MVAMAVTEENRFRLQIDKVGYIDRRAAQIRLSRRGRYFQPIEIGIEKNNPAL